MKKWITSRGTVVTRILGGRSNVFLITSGKKHVLVDTSPGFMRERLFARLEKLDVKALELLLLTHTHFDHAANAAAVQERYRAKVIVHTEGDSFLATGDNVLLYGMNRFTRKLVRKVTGRLMHYAKYEPCRSDIQLNGDCIVFSDKMEIMAIHTPGHTQGSVTYIVDDEIALTGDAMFGVFPGQVMPPFGLDKDQVKQSWGKMLQSGTRIFMPSHGSSRQRRLVEKKYSEFLKITKSGH